MVVSTSQPAPSNEGTKTLRPDSSVGTPAWIDFGREVCGNLAVADTREWLVTNGSGSYAAGTIAGVLTRRYHGLLIAALKPPLGRTLLVSKLDETATYAGIDYPLHANRWGSGVVDPMGFIHLERFHLEGTTPVWTYACGDALLEKRVWMQQGATRLGGLHPRGLCHAPSALQLGHDARNGVVKPIHGDLDLEALQQVPSVLGLRVRPTCGQVCGGLGDLGAHRLHLLTHPLLLALDLGHAGVEPVLADGAAPGEAQELGGLVVQLLQLCLQAHLARGRASRPSTCRLRRML
jgi:hypothetical protein